MPPDELVVLRKAASGRNCLHKARSTWQCLHPDVSRSFDPKALLPTYKCHVTNRYDIDPTVLGEGADGTVRVASDRNSGQKVAIKEVEIRCDVTRELFLKEVGIMKDLTHPNICKVMETYEDGALLYLVMEFCEGGELFDRIVDNGMTEVDSVNIIWQVANALRYAHSRSIAHRDIKPENVMFSCKDMADGHVQVIDWGMAAQFDQIQMMDMVGSTIYAAPEVLTAESLHQEYTCKVDLWSLGVLTYVMLSGKTPFWGRRADILRNMAQEAYPLSGTPWDTVSSDAKDFIASLLKRVPDQRPNAISVLQHPWMMKRTRAETDMDSMRSVLTRVSEFSTSSHLYILCMAVLARQVGHQNLRSVHKVFCELDTNKDGILEIDEFRRGFERVFGAGSVEMESVDQVFTCLDLDRNGTVDYTEFCAASISEHVKMQECVLWSAFKSFDTQSDARITKEAIQRVLQKADLNRRPEHVYGEMARKALRQHDEDHDGTLDFKEWSKMMRNCGRSSTKLSVYARLLRCCAGICVARGPR